MESYKRKLYKKYEVSKNPEKCQNYELDEIDQKVPKC